MTQSPPLTPPALGSSFITRALCVLILVLMAVAAVYGGSMAIAYFHQIGV